jgi:choline dehydrogenase-like flavoprotein
MKPDFDIIIVGSGPAGVSVAFPLLEAGLRVLMVDGGEHKTLSSPSSDFLTARSSDQSQWKWMIGEDFYALQRRDAVSPKLRVPIHAYAFEGFAKGNQILGENFVTLGSMARGGLSNVWGCGVARFSAQELTAFPFAASELDQSYESISRRIGISGKVQDDLTDYFGLDEYSQPPIELDRLHQKLLKNYIAKSKKLRERGFSLGRSRVAALSQDLGTRKACNLSGNCLLGCSRESLYSATHDLPALRRFENFSELPGMVVDRLNRSDDIWQIKGRLRSKDDEKTVSASKIILAAGTLATTKIAFKTLNYRTPARLLASPNAAFLLWLPSLLGASRLPGFGLGQLSYSLGLKDGITAFGSTFSTTGIPVSEFARHLPLKRPLGISFLRTLLSSCVVGNVFLPGDLTDAQVKFSNQDSLVVSGKFGDRVSPLMKEAHQKLRAAYLALGALVLPGSFTIGQPGGDIHYSGTMPMKEFPVAGQTSATGEIQGLDGVYVVDGACLPTLPEKSHTLTIMANADRVGKAIARFFKE